MLTLQQTATQGNAFMHLISYSYCRCILVLHDQTPDEKTKELKNNLDELKRRQNHGQTGGNLRKNRRDQRLYRYHWRKSFRACASKEAIVKDMTDVPASKIILVTGYKFTSFILVTCEL